MGDINRKTKKKLHRHRHINSFNMKKNKTRGDSRTSPAQPSISSDISSVLLTATPPQASVSRSMLRRFEERTGEGEEGTWGQNDKI